MRRCDVTSDRFEQDRNALATAEEGSFGEFGIARHSRRVQLRGAPTAHVSHARFALGPDGGVVDFLDRSEEMLRTVAPP
jgi:hypothetical protein